MSCPTPVIKTKQALARAGGLQVRVLVDDGAPRENILRFAETHGCKVTEEMLESGWQLTLLPGGNAATEIHPDQHGKQSVILVGSDRLGEGPDELGRLLMKNFIITLLELPDPPEVIFFINSGVQLTSEGSELLEPLHKLAEVGTGIYSCGVCLDYFGLRDKLVAGKVTNMYTIAEKLLAAGNPVKV
jgi:selenium metabolism protein YedF